MERYKNQNKGMFCLLEWVVNGCNRTLRMIRTMKSNKKDT